MPADVPGLKTVPLGELGTEPWKGATGGTNKPANTPAPTVTAPSPAPSWLTSPDAWRVLKAAGVPSPGNIPLPGGVSGWKREEKWDAKAGKGTAGATITHTESPLAEGSFTFELWLDRHPADWAAWLAIFRYDATKKTGQSVAVYHPALASLQPPVTDVVMTGHTPILPDARGRAEVTISLKETRPSKAVGSSTAGKGSVQYYQAGKSGPGANGVQEDPAITKLRQQAAALAKEAQEASG